MKKDLVPIKTDEDVQAIREKYEYYGEDKNINKNTAVYHIRQLLKEVERLRGMQSRLET
jgi:hypothetical protein